jgi:hypothetical protein
MTVHIGRPMIQTTSTGVLILCPHGHVIEHVRTADWAGSWAEARVADQAHVVKCSGGKDDES